MRLRLIFILIVLNTFLISCRKEINDGMIVFTVVPGNAISDLTSGASKIVALDPEEPGKPLKVLTGDFFYASHPQISYDGKSMLFEGKKNGNDPVQIWKMDLRNSKTTRITGSKQNCTGAVWLPGDKIVFNSKSGNNSQHALFTCKADGSGISRITFDPYIYSSLSVLKDGRITALRNETGSGEHAKLMVLRPDGTKAQIFCLSPDSSYKTGPMHENADGLIFFVEKNTEEQGDIISVRYNNPFNSRENLTGDTGINFYDVVPLKTGKLLVTFKNSENNIYSLGIFDPESRKIVETFYEDQNNQVVEAVVVQSQERPKKLPSEVDPGVKTGLLLCQDINCTFTLHKPSVSIIPKADRIEIVGIDSVLGVVKTENDGSVYLKVIADTPFRIKTYDEKGNLVLGSSDWIYLRPNERRGCVGCHEDQELVPENKLSQAVARQPVNIPVHTRSIKEKVILLE